MKTMIVALGVAFSASLCAAQPSNPAAGPGSVSSSGSEPQMTTMEIRLSFDGGSSIATLVDSPTTRDSLSLLPLTLTLEDYASTEKIARLPRKLSTRGAPDGVDPDVGDIT